MQWTQYGGSWILWSIVVRVLPSGCQPRVTIISSRKSLPNQSYCQHITILTACTTLKEDYSFSVVTSNLFIVTVVKRCKDGANNNIVVGLQAQKLLRIHSY